MRYTSGMKPSICLECGDGFESSRSHTKYCAPACKQKAYRKRPRVGIAHQKVMRDSHDDGREVMTTLDGCKVRKIEPGTAADIIRKYEWLGTLGKPVACYGLIDPDGEVIGVASFGRPVGTNSAQFLGAEYEDKIILLERGACVHWAHPHAASFMITRACKQAAKDYGWKAFIAYSDTTAGEIGTVYQASNWSYLGQNVGRRGKRYLLRPPWVEVGDIANYIGERCLRERSAVTRFGRCPATFADARIAGYEIIATAGKHKYVHIEAPQKERKRLMKLLETKPYPKR